MQPHTKSHIPPFGIAIHGGAGTILKQDMSPELEAAYHCVMQESLTTGYSILAEQGNALDAVEQAVKVLEDSPLFNAAKGAVFSNSGENELDAAIMDGSNLMAGMVAGVSRIKNPILLARAIMEKSPHVMLIGKGAELFAEKHGIEIAPHAYFYLEKQWQKLQRAKLRALTGQHENISEEEKHGTVGAVALDQKGNLAAGTSTGGMTNKHIGRVGDSPIIGAGTYANNATCAVSATGHGEYYMRLVVSYDISALMAYQELSLKNAAEKVIFEKLSQLGGTGGLVAIDKSGNIVMPFNTDGMYRGSYSNGILTTKIYND
jgi:beta-aspartyl-peptidase (threonine type)